MAQSKKKYKVTGKRGAPSKKGGGRAKGSGRGAAKARDRSELRFSQFVPFILFIVAILMVLSFFISDFGAIGNFIRDKVFFGIFSTAYYLFPFLLIAIGVILLSSDETPKARWIVICVVGFLIIDVLCHLFLSYKPTMKDINPFVQFRQGTHNDVKNLNGGGFVGGTIGALLCACFSRAGAIIIVIAAAAALVLIMLRKTPKDAVRGLSESYREKKEVRDARREEDRSRREAELAARRAEEEERRRIEEEEYLRAEEERRLAEERAAAVSDYEGGFYGYSDDGYLDSDIFTEPRKTEFDPTITDEDFPITKKEDDAEAPELLEPVAKADSDEVGDALGDDAIFDADDDAVLDMLSKTYLGGDALAVEERDLDPTLSGGEVVEIPEEPKYLFPDVDFLIEDKSKKDVDYRRELESKEAKLIQTLEKFNVHTESAGLPSKGPTVTRYELRPAPGTRVRAIVNLVDDIALSLAKGGIRIEAPIPGKSAVGIEVPNDERATVRLRTLIDSDAFREADSILTLALGEDVAGAPVYFDLAKMPHLLIAGATGMGKSVCVNCLIVSILYRAKPDEVQFIMIDPKRVEFNIYEGLPHLIVPVVTDPKKAAGALSWAVNEMERRFGLLEEAKVRNVAAYNEKAANDPTMKPMPRIVIIIDELADLMSTASDSVENSIKRLAAKARAAGLHLIIGTQRPSVDVITGTIKNNIPSRIACTVASQIDSRTIIDVPGAEKLLGKGDILFNPVGSMHPIRVQGAFVDEPEITKIVSFIIENNTKDAGYDDDVMSEIETEAVRCTATKKELATMAEEASLAAGDEDPMFWRAVELAVESGKISTSLIQRKCSLGFGRAAKLIDKMEELGFVSEPDGQKPRRVLITKERLQEIKMGGFVIPQSQSEDDGDDMTDDDMVF